MPPAQFKQIVDTSFNFALKDIIKSYYFILFNC